MASWVIAIFLVASSTCMLIMILKHWLVSRRTQDHFSRQGIKGPPHRLFIGNMKEIVEMMLKASSQPFPSPVSHNILPRVLPFYYHWKKIYGKIFLIWFGPTPRLTVSDPDLIREIFTGKSEFYEKNDSQPLVKMLEGEGLLSLNGEKWSHHRRIISPNFHMENLKLLVPVVGNSVMKMLDKWEVMCSKCGTVEIEVSRWFENLTEDVIARVTFGTTSYEDGKDIFRLQAQQMVFAAEAFQKVFIPGYRFLPTSKNIKSWKLDKEIKKSLVKLINRRKSDNHRSGSGSDSDADTMLDKGSCPIPKDLLGLMIEASKSATSSSSSSTSTTSSNSVTAITVHDIVEECKTFFFAGKDTTSSLLTWTTLLLAMHPSWQVQARDEVFRVCGSRDVPTKDDVGKLKKMSMIINESLRLYPPAVAMLRRANTNIELGRYKIPKGIEILIPIIAIHHDQTLWGEDASEFNPTRFAEGVARAAKHPLAFIPFGLGVRMCIGQNLAILQAKLTLATILRRFSFQLAPSYLHAPNVRLLLHPKNGAPVIFRRLTEIDEPNHSLGSNNTK